MKKSIFSPILSLAIALITILSSSCSKDDPSSQESPQNPSSEVWVPINPPIPNCTFYGMTAYNGILYTIAKNSNSLPGGDIYSSSDFGNSWNFLLHNDTIIFTPIYAIENAMIYNGGSEVHISNLDGSIMTKLFSQFTKSSTHPLCINSDVYFSGSFQGNYTSKKSIDGGYNWTDLTSLGLTGYITEFLFFNNSVYAFGDGVFKQNTWNGSWSRIDAGLPAVTQIRAATANGTKMFAYDDNYVYVSNDNGYNWAPYIINPTLTFLVQTELFGTSNSLYWCELDTIVVTHDGITWLNDMKGILEPRVVPPIFKCGNYAFTRTDHYIYRKIIN